MYIARFGVPLSSTSTSKNSRGDVCAATERLLIDKNPQDPHARCSCWLSMIPPARPPSCLAPHFARSLCHVIMCSREVQDDPICHGCAAGGAPRLGRSGPARAGTCSSRPLASTTKQSPSSKDTKSSPVNRFRHGTMPPPTTPPLSVKRTRTSGYRLSTAHTRERVKSTGGSYLRWQIHKRSKFGGLFLRGRKRRPKPRLPGGCCGVGDP